MPCASCCKTCSPSISGDFSAHHWRRLAVLCQRFSNGLRSISSSSQFSAARRCSMGRLCTQPNQPIRSPLLWRSTVRHWFWGGSAARLRTLPLIMNQILLGESPGPSNVSPGVARRLVACDDSRSCRLTCAAKWTVIALQSGFQNIGFRMDAMNSDCVCRRFVWQHGTS